MALSNSIALPRRAGELRELFLRDLRLAAIDTGLLEEPPVQPGTDWYLLGEASSRLAMIGVGHLALSDGNRSVLTATGASLRQIRDAYGIPEVPSSGATGKIVPDIFGVTTIVNGTEFVYPNGFRGRVVGTYINPQPADEIDVEAVDVGDGTNLGPGNKVRFVSPPVNVAVEATVSTGEPLTGGTDDETDERLRDRILNVLRNKPAGGNWAYLRQIVLDKLGSVQDCYVYPALGGPSSCKVVPVKDFSPDENDFTRSVTTATLQTVRGEIWAKVPIGDQIVTQAVADQEVDFTIKLEIPESAMAGGNGQGWTDQAPWPQLEAADANTIIITDVQPTHDVITIDAATTVPPIAGLTNIAWWSKEDRKFYTALITSINAATPGAWEVTLDRPLRGKNGSPATEDDYICPAAENIEAYGDSWVNLFRALGPGPNTTDADRLPRALRHPYVTDEDRSSITTTALTSMVSRHPEITDISFGYAPTTAPTVPASVDDAPNVLTPRRFAIYPI